MLICLSLIYAGLRARDVSLHQSASVGHLFSKRSHLKGISELPERNSSDKDNLITDEQGLISGVEHFRVSVKFYWWAKAFYDHDNLMYLDAICLWFWGIFLSESLSGIAGTSDHFFSDKKSQVIRSSSWSPWILPPPAFSSCFKGLWSFRSWRQMLSFYAGK